MPNYAEINHASAEFRQNWECRHAGRIFGNAEMLWCHCVSLCVYLCACVCTVYTRLCACKSTLSVRAQKSTAPILKQVTGACSRVLIQVKCAYVRACLNKFGLWIFLR